MAERCNVGEKSGAMWMRGAGRCVRKARVDVGIDPYKALFKMGVMFNYAGATEHAKA